MMANKVDMHLGICQELNEIYDKKNNDYGDSFHQTWVEEGFAMARIRLSDKLNRFKRLSKNDSEQKVKDESIEDTLLDLANYAIMTVLEMRLDNKREHMMTELTGTQFAQLLQQEANKEIENERLKITQSYS